MTTKKKSVPLPDAGIDWSSPVGEFQPTSPAANDAPPAAEQPSSNLRRAADYLPTLVKSAIAVPEFAVGMADLVTGGRAGKFLENEGGAVGFRPKEARAALDEFYSPEQKAAFQEVQNADGFIGTGMAALRNPSVIGQSVVESLGLMGAGGVVARGLGAVAPGVSATMRGAIGEGVVGAGSAAEQIRQETADGLLTGKQAALGAASGLADTAFGALGGKIAQRLGIADVDTMLAGKGNPAATKGFVRSLLEGAASEGLLEELPQSISEQVLQNVALGKPVSEGVDQAAVLGLLSGGLMGGGANAVNSMFPAAHPADEIRATKMPATGPLTKGLNAAIETHAETVESTVADAVTQTRRQKTAPIVEQLRSLPPEQQDEALQMMAIADNMQAPGPVRRRAQNRLDFLFASVAPPVDAAVDPTTGEIAPATGQPPDDMNLPRDNLAAATGSEQQPVSEADSAASRAAAVAQREADRPESAITPRQDGDILTGSGNPFKNMTAAMRALGKAGDGFELARVDGGLVVRKTAAPSEPVERETPTVAADLAGDPIDKEWTAFTPESGTKGIPRAEMPQIQAAHRGPMVNFLNARGITHETVEIPAGELKPTQAEFSPAKVQKAKDFTDTDRSILVSSDGHVLDGHHQWLARLESNEPVKAIRLNAPIADLITTVREFPSAGQADGATTAQPAGTLQEQWQDAVKRGDAEAAAKINDLIVAEKKARKAAAPADDTNPTSGTRAEAQAAADQAPAPARSDAATPASVPAAGGAATAETGGVNQAAAWNATLPKDRVAILERAGWAANSKSTQRMLNVPWDKMSDSQRTRVGAAMLQTAKATPDGDGQQDELDAEMRSYERKAEQQAPVDAQPAHINGIHGWWAVGGTAGQADSLTKVGRIAALNAIGINDKQSGLGKVADLEKRHWTYLPDDVRTKLAALRRDGWKPDAATGQGSTNPDTKPVQDSAGSETPSQALINEALNLNVPNPGRLTKPALQAAVDAAKEKQSAEFARIRAEIAAKPKPNANTIITDDAAEKARAILRAKLGQVSSGIDPEIMSAGITLALYHVEKGARTFAAYTKAMVGDLGDTVRPYLKSWYAAVLFDPRAGAFTAEMTPLDKLDQAPAAEAETGPVVIPASEEAFAEALNQAEQSDAGDRSENLSAELNQANGEADRYNATFKPAIKPVSLPRTTSAKPKPDGVEFLTPDQANARIAEWKAEAARQGKKFAGKNGMRTVISLFDASGVLAQPWHEAGYNVVAYDLQTGADISEFNAENLLEQHGNDEVWAILAQPPCTDFASSGAQWWKDKDEDGRTEASNELVRQVLRTVELFRPPVWVMENPVGRIAKLNKLPEPTLSFDPWNFGDPYTKRTLLWGNFNPNLPTAMVEPVDGSKIHRMSSSAKYERSLTSEPFAYALFMANNAEGLSPAKRLAAEFAGVDISLFDAALKAGESESDIRDAIVDSYYDSDLEYVRQQLAEMAGKAPDSGPDAPVDSQPAAQDTAAKDKTDGSVPTPPRNAARQLDQPGQGTLEGTPSTDVRAPGKDRQAGTGADGRGRRDGSGAAGTDRAGNPVAGRLGANPGDVPVPARRTRQRTQDSPQQGLFGASGSDAGTERLRPEQGGLAPEGGVNEAPNGPGIAAPQFKAEDFTIDSDLALGEGGQKTKFKNNVAAIRLVRDLEATGRLATPDEQRTLAQYVGWGGLPQAFDPDNADWSREHKELSELLTPEEFAEARKSTRYAHYTSREIVVDGVYAALRRFGFTGGKTLEAGAGVGNFIGMMPADMRSAGRFTAIEREPFSGAIARQLYPKQNVQQADFTEFKGSDGYYDAAVGNPPFASDPQVDRSGRKHLSGLTLHNYFFAKAIDMLREGGVMGQVITNSFMDAKTDAARRYIGERTRFLGAIRLPNNAFSKNANTEVTTDIVFLQKLPDAEIGSKAARADAKRWIDTVAYTDKNGAQVALNRYFADNPHMMLGDYGAFGTMYGPNQPALVARPGQDTLAMLKAAVEKLPEGIFKSLADTASTEQVRAAVIALKNPPVREGGYFLEGDKLIQRVTDIAGEARGTEITPDTAWTEKTKLGDAGFARIKALSELRGTVRALIAAEMADDDKSMGQLRARLNEQYDSYRDTHGLLNDPSTLRVFDDDPDYPLLASLETDYKAGIGPAAAKRQGIKVTKSSAKKSAIFTRRVVAARTAVRKVDTAVDALAVSMAERGKLDAAYIGELLGKDPEAVLKELSSGDKPALFLDPATSEYVLRDAYLSGNVRAKLAQAREAGMVSNARELEAVQPEDVGAHEISARVGSPWVPESVYEDFAKELFGDGSKARVRYLKLNSSYQFDVAGASEVALNNTWGTPRVSGDAILSALLNNKPIKVVDYDSEGKAHANVEATEAANVKAQDIRDRFGDWLFKDPDRAEMLVRAYNDTNNNYVTRVYDGSMMTFPGKVPDEIIKFRRHQRNAIARTVQDRTALYDHVVGAGKTFTVIASAMELKRTGLAKKPMIAVPNHLVKQWAADFYRLYPGANILTATKKDFLRENRRKFLAKIATGDWDAVVIAHSSFGFIKPAPEFEADFNGKQIADIVATIKAVDDGDGEKQQKKRTIKQLEGLKERLENRVKALRDKPMDDLLDFQQIGVDQLFVDEFHMFKNLMFSTKMQNVQGLGDSTGSQRAYDMYVKIAQIFQQNGRGQGVVAATGTPVSNSLAEMYHMMRYLMPTQMEELGFGSFDAWANTFASVEQVWMQKPSGDGFKASNRMSNFVNTTELLKMFDQVCDTVTMDDIKAAYREENEGAEFPLPQIKTGRRQPVSLDKSPAQDAYMEEIAKRAKALEQRRGPPQKGEDNTLVIMGDARKAAMDIRLVDPNITEREPGGRIDRAAQEIEQRYRQYQAVRGTQLVFSDLGTPIKHAKAEMKEFEALRERIDAATDDVQADAALGDEAAKAKVEDAEDAQAELDAKGADWLTAVKAALRGFSVYDDLKAALIERGIPENQIAFIHDYNTDDQKAGLFKQVNAGQIRVLIGSTAKMGAGTNVQERLVAEHHLDVPWRPSDVEQREGRIIRQGNALMKELKDFEAEILAYVTRDTLDMRMWQVQETKLKMINQLRTRKVAREVDNAFEDMEMSAGEMQAAATGNMDLLKEIQLRTDVKKLEQRQRSFDAQAADLQSRRKRAERLAEVAPQEVKKWAPWAEASKAWAAQQAEDRKVSVTVNGTEYTSRAEAGGELRRLLDAHQEKLDARKAGYDAAKDAAKTQFPGDDGEAAAQRLNVVEAYSKAHPLPKLSIEFNNSEYNSKTAVVEAFIDAVGDTNRFDWTFEGKPYIHQSKAVSAIADRVMDAGENETEQDIGSFGPFKVSVEGMSTRLGTRRLDVIVRHDGKTISDDISFRSISEVKEAGEANARAVIERAQSLVAGSQSKLYFAQEDVRKAEKALKELSAVADAGEWPDKHKLDAARQAHKDVLKRLSAVAAPTDAAAADGETPALSRTEPVDRRSVARRLEDVTQLAEQITSRWANAPEVVVVEDMSDPRVPESIRAEDTRQQSQGATGSPEGIYYKGKVYLVASELHGDADVVRVLFHEALGHAGLRGTFGKELGVILDRLAVLNQGKVRSKAKQYGLDYDKPSDRRAAAEEVLAEMAQTRPEIGWVKRAVAAIRTFLRDHVPGFSRMKMSDDEIVRNFILPARRFVEQGGIDSTGDKPTFSRGNATRGIISVKQIGSKWAVTRNQGTGNEQHLGYHDSEAAANEQADAERTTAKRAAGKGAAWWVENSTQPIRPAGRSQLDGLGRSLATTATLDARSASIKTVDQGLRLKQLEDRAGFCFKLAAEAAANDVGAMVIGEASNDESTVWHAVVVRDGMIYDPTFARWFEPGIYERLGFTPRLTLTPEEVRDYIAKTGGMAPDAKNQGLVDGNAPKFSRSPAEMLRSINQESIRNAFLDATTGHDNVNLWAKTVGTQYDKAQRNPQTFGRVFNAVQDYIKDISSFANAAADQAPSILPKLDDFRDLLRSGTSRADLNAVGAVIFQGTLDKQLLDRPALLAKGLTEKQADLYDEFRAAVNQSLDDVAKTEIVRLAGIAGEPMAGRALAAPTAREAADIMADYLRQQGLPEDADGLYGKVETVEKLQSEGYAPLMRFGKHTVHIQQDGETLFFGMYESRAEANAMARQLRGDPEFSGIPVEQGVMSQESYKLFNGLSIDSLELFANEVGGQDNPVYQDFLKLTKNNRSALKRLIHRNGTAGFSTNTERVLASFVTSNARLASGNLHLGRAKQAANDIPRELGDLKDEAVRLVEYVQNPQEEAQAVRGLLFTTFIGGSVASAVVNMTQPLTMTLPYLSQFGGLTKAGARMVAALKIVAGGKATGELGQALKRAEADGIVSPQEIHHLQAATTDSLGNNPYLKKAAFIWGSMFSLAEQFNRRISFVAAYQTALDTGVANPFAFAEKAVIETQGLYNKGNKANWARGAIGSTAMTFKQFSTHYIEWITRMHQSGPEGKRAAITALAILMLAGGAGGLPFADDLDDLIDTLAQALGYDFSAKQAKRKFIAETLGLGDTAAEVATRGVTALPGFPMDLSLRMGMGNLLPATGMFLRSNTDRSRDLLEVAGAAGGLAKMALDGGEKLLGGDPLGAAKAVVPLAIQNVAKSAQMWTTGEYRNQKGAKVTDVDGLDAAMKFIGFQPAEVARESAKVNSIQRTIQLAKNVEADLAGRMAQARVDGDIEAEQEARQELIDWNRKNPQSPIRIRPADIARRAREMRASRADRLVKSAPKELRPAVQDALN